MYCRRCPNYPLVEAVIAYAKGEQRPLLAEAMTRLDELRAGCVNCHEKAKKSDTHLGPDRDGGRLNGEVSFDEALFALGRQQGDFATDPDYLAGRKRDTSTGCTTLSPEAEDGLRIVLATIMQLDPMELLLVQHVFTHQPLARFRKKLRELRDRLMTRYDLREVDENGKAVSSFRAIVSLWGRTIIEKVPALSDVFAAAKNETAGTCK